MGLAEIRAQWHCRETDSTASAAKWDALSADFAEHPLPTEDNDKFMALLHDTYRGGSGTALDIGCGTGQYALAIAPKFQQVTGVDISEGMIRHAQQNAEQSGLNRVSFQVSDWEHLPATDPLLTQRYDLVLGHMTSAIDSAAALERMCMVCRGMCYLSKPSRRHDPISDRVRELAGLRPRNDPDMIPNIFSMLWYLGYDPKIEYWNTKWNSKRPLGVATAFYLNDLRESAPVTLETEEKIRDYLQSQAKNDIVQEDAEVLITNVYWSTGPQE
ncbi:MAG: class I SAM-dependent methyltransferase [Methanomethylophilus sp.]